MKRTVISQDNSETIETVTDELRFSIKQEFTGYLPDEANRYKVIVMNKPAVRQLVHSATKWLNGGMK